MGAANKVSGNKITGIKVLKKLYPKRKKPWKYETFSYKGVFFYASP